MHVVFLMSVEKEDNYDKGNSYRYIGCTQGSGL